MNALDALYLTGAVALSPWWARKTRGDWKARFGHTDPLPPSAPSRPRILLHAVSVGEVAALRHLVPLLAPRCELVISVGTDTGIARARELFAASASVVRYPVDFSRCVRRFLDAVKPDAVGLVELELWPNFVAACGRRGIPVAVINGRLSERSFRGYSRVRPLLRRTFASLAVAAVQDAEYAERFRAMGVPADRVQVTGSMKWDAARIEDHVPGAVELGREMGIDPARPLIVAGSTAEDEEALLHAACPPGVQLLCAPRKPEHFDWAARALPGCVRRSRPTPHAPTASAPPGGRFLLDTIGELRKAYALADVVVVGRSFGSLYGSDPIEPAALGKPVVIGPAVKDFESIVRTLAGGPGEAVGLVRTTRDRLAAELSGLLADPARRAKIARTARDRIRAHQGASARHAELLLALTDRVRDPDQRK